jgi:hypothetical protein
MPTPTPIVTEGYVIYQTVTFGDAGLVLALLFVGSLLMINIVLQIVQWLRQ